MADTNRNSIGETEASNGRAPRVVIVGGASVVWLPQKLFARRQFKSF
jgi:hypothetical protein